MLQLSERQYHALATAALTHQLRAFLIARSPDPAMQHLLADERACTAVWTPLHDPARTDYAQALRLTAALVAHLRQEEPAGRLAALDAAPDPEHATKLLLEEAGVVRYSEFDIA